MEITKREFQILRLIIEEHTTKEIANILFLSTETINSHRKNMMSKLKARNTAGLVSKAYRNGIVLFSLTVLIAAIIPGISNAQTRNLYIEGTGDQYGVIRSTSTGNSRAGLELLRSSEFQGTDWRIQNEGGQLLFEDGIDNFLTPGDLNMRIATNGTVNLFNGTDAEVNDNTTGILILGDPAGNHLAIDNNSIISRNNEIGAQLLLQTGLDKGDTYLNNLSGNVGIGTTVPGAKLGLEDNGFQMRFGNTQDFNNDWYIGASHSGWSVGEGKLVISPSTSSSSAMLILDRDNSTISARSNRVIQVEDPVNDRDAVNLRTLNSAIANVSDDVNSISFISPKEISFATTETMTFAECAEHCRDYSFAGHEDWSIPSLEHASHFVGSTISSQFIWTSEVEQYAYAYYIDRSGTNDEIVTRGFTNRMIIDLQNGGINSVSVEDTNVEQRCRCIR